MTRNESIEYTSTFNSRNKKEGMKSPMSASIKFIF
jgi:hypothetical protein